MREPVISVIIPIYNTAIYLRRCLDSVTGQTYEDLEIILVDDGSTDGSGTICDEYAARDGRIRVIHKDNGGVSSARNAGLTVASGGWLGWVDSDDWIEPDMYAYLLNATMKKQADITVCGRYECYRGKSVFRGWDREVELNTEDALESLLNNGNMQNSLWDKLYRRELFDRIAFPQGHGFEDLAVMHSVFERAERVICLPEAKYHYLLRQDSIVGNASLESRMDHFIAAKNRYDEMLTKYPKFSVYLEGQCVASAISVWCAYFRNSKTVRERYAGEIETISRFAKEHYRSVSRLELGMTGKIVVRLTPYPAWWSFSAAYLCGQLYKLKYGRAL